MADGKATDRNRHGGEDVDGNTNGCINERNRCSDNDNVGSDQMSVIALYFLCLKIISHLLFTLVLRG